MDIGRFLSTSTLAIVGRTHTESKKEPAVTVCLSSSFSPKTLSFSHAVPETKYGLPTMEKVSIRKWDEGNDSESENKYLLLCGLTFSTYNIEDTVLYFLHTFTHKHLAYGPDSTDSTLWSWI